jgi:antitoxin (DNA-binding transcriptional repressor) of toxin-antitoxin stability system
VRKLKVKKGVLIMSEQIKKKRPASQKNSTSQGQDTERPNVSDAKEKISEVLNAVTYGAESMNVSAAGRTVGEIRQHMKHVLNIPEDAQSRVNGNLVDGDYVLQDNDTLEFVKVSGQKGI